MWAQEEPKKAEGQPMLGKDPYYQNPIGQSPQAPYGSSHRLPDVYGQPQPQPPKKSYAEGFMERYLGFLHPAYWRVRMAHLAIL